jgi:N-methylhydantoinase B
MNPDILSNDGFYRPIQVLVPQGTILNPNHPAPRAARGLTGFRTVDTVAGALHRAMPTAVGAAGEGGATMIAMGGHSESGSPFIFIDFMCSGWGARPTKDGVDGTSSIAANLSNVPIEEVELRQPVKVEEYGFVPDTGGPGKWRGSLSVVRQLRFLEQEGVLQIRSDRRKFPPYGLEGGNDGTSSWNILNPGPSQEILPTNITCHIVEGDVLRHIMAGGGGFGDPLERNPALVLKDIVQEKISVDYALREYGVVVDGAESQLNMEQTKKIREAMIQQRQSAKPAEGPRHKGGSG